MCEKVRFPPELQTPNPTAHSASPARGLITSSTYPALNARDFSTKDAPLHCSIIQPMVAHVPKAQTKKVGFKLDSHLFSHNSTITLANYFILPPKYFPKPSSVTF